MSGGYGPSLGGPGINTSPGALGGIYNPTNPALALFTTQSENPTAAGAGFFSNSGFSSLNFSTVANAGQGGYATPAGGIGSVGPITGLQNCLNEGNTFLGCLAKGFGAGVGAIGGQVGSGVASGLGASGFGQTIVLIAIATVLLLGAFFLIGTGRLASVFKRGS